MSNSDAAAPPPAGVTPNFEHPQDVLHTVNLVSNVLCIAVVTPFVLVRVYIKTRIVRSFNTEDCKLS
jgi:hypothetical protein